MMVKLSRLLVVNQLLCFIYRVLIYSVDDFVLKHINLWRKSNQCLILEDFNAPVINWKGLSPMGPNSVLDSSLLMSAMRNALLQQIFKPIRLGI